MQHRPKKIRLSSGILLSALGHLSACGIFVLMATFEKPVFDERRIINVKIKGTRDKELLPRQVVQEPKSEPPKVEEKLPEPKAVSEPETVTKPEPKPVAKPEPKPMLQSPSPKPVADKHAMKAPDKPKVPSPKLPSALETLQKRLKSLEKVGDEEGVDFGNSTSGDVYSYEAKIKSILDSIYRLPSFLGEQERKTLLVVVNILIDDEGRPESVRVVRPSKNPAFDHAVVKMVNSVVAFGPPPLPLRKKLKNQGQDIEWCPIACDTKGQI